MQLEHSFTVPVPVDDAWRVLLDIEQIAPCMPGAILDSVDGDDFTGRVKVKLGPISLTYKGKASFVKKDEATHTAVIDAAGKDQRGNGTAAATVTATLKSEGGSSTRVDVLTDLNITGKPAQFGRGVMVDVGNKLIGQFATCVEGKLSANQTSDSGADSTESSAGGAAAVVAAESTGVTGGTSGTASAQANGGSTGGRHAAEAAGARVAEGGSPSATKSSPASSAAKSTSASSAAKSTSATTSTKSTSTSSAPRPRAVPAREPEPIDLLEVAGGSVLTRIGIPAASLATALLILLFIIRKIRS